MKSILLSCLIIVILAAIPVNTIAQDLRTLDTKIADLLAQFPAENGTERDGLAQKLLSLGSHGLLKISAMLTPYSKSDDTAVRYALNGLTHYAAGEVQDDVRSLVVSTYINGLETAKSREAKAFFIRQLQMLGSEDAIQVLGNYLKLPALYEPATQALIVIGESAKPSAKAAKVLYSALRKTKDDAMKVCFIKALGDLEYGKAARNIAKYSKSEDAVVQDAALYTLSAMGQKHSYKTLLAAAEVKGYQPYLLRYAENRHLQGDIKMAAEIYGKLLNENLIASHIRSAALAGIVAITGDKSSDLLLAAMESKDKDYRGQALHLARTVGGPGSTSQWVSKMQTLSPEIASEIIGMLTLRGDEKALAPLSEMVANDSPEIQNAAINAVVKMGGDRAFPTLLPLLNTGSSATVKLIETSLLSYAGEATINGIARVLPSLPPVSQESMLRILGERGNYEHFPVIFDIAEKSTDANVQLQALKALKPLARADDMSRLLGLINPAMNDELKKTAMAAVVASGQKITEPENRADALLSSLPTADPALQTLFLGALPELGGSKALNAVRKSAKSRESEIQTQSLKSLMQWPEAAAAPDLLKLYKTTDDKEYRIESLKGYVRLIKQNENPEEKLKSLQPLIKLATSAEDKSVLLSGLTSVRTSESLDLAAQFLDGSAQTEAVSAVVQIALPQAGVSRGLTGDKTVRILKSVMPLVESQYTKEEIRKHIERISENSGTMKSESGVFIPLFNGRDLTGWKGLVGNPASRAKMSPDELAKAQDEADASMHEHWKIVDDVLVFDGKGSHLCTVRDYSDFEMLVDWKIGPEGDSGIYLRGSPQVQIWDPAQWPEGSGGLYNNQKNPSKPLVKADNPIGEWNTFRIKMIGERVTVHLNGTLVVDNVVMENYWERNIPIYPSGQIELQSHGNPLYFKNVYIREIPREDEWKRLFNGKDLEGWTGAVKDVKVENGTIIYPKKGGGNIYTSDQYGDFILRFEFKLTPGANNGLGIRTPLTGDAAYAGMELQILDNTASIYKNLKRYQYHGSVYGVIPADRGFLNPVGEWNFEEVIARGDHIIVNLNGTTIVDGDIRKASIPGTMDGRDHPGLLRKKGHIGFLGHGSHVEFRNIFIKSLDK